MRDDDDDDDDGEASGMMNESVDDRAFARIEIVAARRDAERLTDDDRRRNASYPDALVVGFPPPFENVRTLHDAWESMTRRFAAAPCLGTRRYDAKTKTYGAYEFATFEDVGRERVRLCGAFATLGIERGACVGLYSINTPEWVALEAAATRRGAISVPLYDTLGPDAVVYIANHAALTCVACSEAVLGTMVGCLRETPTVKLIISYGGRGAGSSNESAVREARERLPPGVRLVTYEECLEIGAKNQVPATPAGPDDLATICYTSGTTGAPKGVMLTHKNLISNAAGYAYDLQLSPSDCHISYLPLAHIYERVTMLVCLFNGAHVGFYRGDVLMLLDDIAELKPTVFCSVPRLWNRIYDKVNAGVREGSVVARKLFHWAYESKKRALMNGKAPNPFFERLVFSKLRAKLGGNVRYMSTGSAPISAEVMEFLRICFGTVLEGYGMTESACVISKTSEDDFTTGHVGVPAPCCEIKLVDVPEMRYTHLDKPHPRGEICVRGPSVFVGYYKSPEQTEEVLDRDGWLHTGDIGTWLPGGRLKIIDRKKNIFKLAQGEYVAPEKIENVYARNKFVAQSFVYGDSLQAYLVAVVVPDAEILLPWAKQKGFRGNTMQALCADPKVRQHILESMIQTGREAGLKGFEQVRAIALCDELFSVENNLITPTFKLKRPQAKERFQRDIAAMYATK